MPSITSPLFELSVSPGMTADEVVSAIENAAIRLAEYDLAEVRANLAGSRELVNLLYDANGELLTRLRDAGLSTTPYDERLSRTLIRAGAVLTAAEKL